MSGSFIRDQALGLAAAGHAVRVVHIRAAANETGTPTVSDSAGVLGVARIVVRGGRSAFHQPRMVWHLWWHVRQWTREGFRPDVVHAHTDKAALPAWAVARSHRATFVVTEHSSEWVDPATPRPAGRRRWLARRTFASADVVISVSRYLASSLERALGIAGVVVLPNPVDDVFFRVERGSEGTARQLVSTGALVREKDFALLVRAFALVRREQPCQLTIIGEGDWRRQLVDIASQLDVADDLRLPGLRPRGEVARLLGAADLYVCSSSVETFGVAVVEALASGLPVVSTRCGGPEEFVVPEVGVLVGTRHERELAARIRECLVPGRFDSHQVREYARSRFSAEVIAAGLCDVYAQR